MHWMPRTLLQVRLRYLIVLFAVTLPLAGASAAQDAASARAFLTSAFRLYEHSGRGVAYSRRYYHSSLLALINADSKAAADNQEGPPFVGTDVFINCQDWEGFWVIKLDLSVQTPQRAEAIVTFSPYAPENTRKEDVRKYKYVLIQERGQWRVYDILYLSIADYPIKSLRQNLQEDIKAYRHQIQ